MDYSTYTHISPCLFYSNQIIDCNKINPLLLVYTTITASWFNPPCNTNKLIWSFILISNCQLIKYLKTVVDGQFLIKKQVKLDLHVLFCSFYSNSSYFMDSFLPVVLENPSIPQKCYILMIWKTAHFFCVYVCIHILLPRFLYFLRFFCFYDTCRGCCENIKKCCIYAQWIA